MNGIQSLDFIDIWTTSADLCKSVDFEEFSRRNEGVCRHTRLSDNAEKAQNQRFCKGLHLSDGNSFRYGHMGLQLQAEGMQTKVHQDGD